MKSITRKGFFQVIFGMIGLLFGRKVISASNNQMHLYTVNNQSYLRQWGMFCSSGYFCKSTLISKEEAEKIVGRILKNEN